MKDRYKQVIQLIILSITVIMLISSCSNYKEVSSNNNVEYNNDNDNENPVDVELEYTEENIIETNESAKIDDDIYTPNYSDSKTVVIKDKISNSMPVFEFEIFAYKNDDLNSYAIQSIKISEINTNKFMQEIDITKLCGMDETQTTDDITMGFKLEDLNFDGYKDIKLFDFMNGNYAKAEIYLVWNRKLGIFENDVRLKNITNPVFDQDKKVIYGMERGSAVDHYYSTYKYREGEIVCIETYDITAVWLPNENQTLVDAINYKYDKNIDREAYVLTNDTRRKLNETTGELEIVSDVYAFHDVDYNVVAEFNTNSEFGDVIKKLDENDEVLDIMKKLFEK